MKGNNTLRLNGATLTEALQEYLDKRYNPKVTVAGVTMLTLDSAPVFEVKVEEIVPHG